MDVLRCRRGSRADGPATRRRAEWALLIGLTIAVLVLSAALVAAIR